MPRSSRRAGCYDGLHAHKNAQESPQAFDDFPGRQKLGGGVAEMIMPWLLSLFRRHFLYGKSPRSAGLVLKTCAHHATIEIARAAAATRHRRRFSHHFFHMPEYHRCSPAADHFLDALPHARDAGAINTTHAIAVQRYFSTASPLSRRARRRYHASAPRPHITLARRRVEAEAITCKDDYFAA